MDAVALVVIAKAPAPGRSKTRLCPPCTPEQAAGLAAAALRDTLAAVAATPARRRLLALDGEPDGWPGADGGLGADGEPNRRLGGGFELVEQAGAGLGERLGHALCAAGGPALVVGMDTPQLTPDLLARAGRTLVCDGVDAVLGPAHDGGYWTIGLRRPDPAVFDSVPMSSPDTGRAQRRRLGELGLRTALLPRLRDVDTFADARAVAAACPGSEFAAAYRGLSAAHATDHEQPVAEATAG